MGYAGQRVGISVCLSVCLYITDGLDRDEQKKPLSKQANDKCFLLPNRAFPLLGGDLNARATAVPVTYMLKQLCY